MLAHMERARQSGKRIGRPRVIDEPGFEAKFSEVVDPPCKGLPGSNRIIQT